MQAGGNTDSITILKLNRDFRPPITQAASANQNVASQISNERSCIAAGSAMIRQIANIILNNDWKLTLSPL